MHTYRLTEIAQKVKASPVEEVTAGADEPNETHSKPFQPSPLRVVKCVS